MSEEYVHTNMEKVESMRKFSNCAKRGGKLSKYEENHHNAKKNKLVLLKKVFFLIYL